jgi:hypothetical protein
MSLPIQMRRRARNELDAAAEWYEQRRTGLGTRFVLAAEQVLAEAAVNPRFSEMFVKERFAGFLTAFTTVRNPDNSLSLPFSILQGTRQSGSHGAEHSIDQVVPSSKLDQEIES